MAYSDMETEIFLDKRFEENLKNAKAAGLKVGVYVYTSANTKEEALKQAKFIKKHLNKVKLDFPIAYDFEEWRDFNSLKMNSHDLLERVNDYKSILEKDGYDIMIYGSKWYLENVWPKNDYDTWLAHYVDETNYKGEYILWQLCSDGLIDGIYGYVDLDIYYKK
jgi:GH25 family lysozyme M1 (1,4-beta-N-acetylmuramidase)